MKKNSLLAFSFFAINPLFSLLYSSYFFMKNRSCVFILSLSISLIFIYQPLMFDVSATFFPSINDRATGLYNYLPDVLRRYLGLDYYYAIYIYTVVIFYCWFKVVAHLSAGINNKFNLVVFLLVSVLFIIYRDIMDLNRFYLSISLALFYVYYLRDKYKEKYVLQTLIFLPLCLFLHPFSAIIFLSYFSSRLLNKKFYYILYLCGCFSIGIFINDYIQLLFISAQGAGIDVPSAYFGDAGWGRNDYSGATLIRKFLEVTIVVNIALFSLPGKNGSERKLNLLLFLCGICLLFFNFQTLFERSFITLSLFAIYCFSVDKRTIILKYTLISLLLMRFVVINFVRYGDVFLEGHTEVLPNVDKKIEIELKPFYYPTLFLLDLDNGYSDDFISTHSVWK